MGDCPLKMVRKQLGISQTDLAVLSEIPIQNVGSTETGEKKYIDSKIIRALKEHTSIDTDQLEKDFDKWLIDFHSHRKENVIKKLKQII